MRDTESLARQLDPAFLQSLTRLDLRAKTLVDGLLAGRHGSARHGFSVEFSDYREYVPGDDVQDIDWNVYVRTDQYYVKRYRAETNLRCMLLLDVSASMAYRSPSAVWSKLDYARTIAAAIAHLLVRQRDRVGLTTLRERPVRHVPPRSRRAHLHRLYQELARARAEGAGRLGAALGDVALRLRRRGLVIVLSDFLPPAGAEAGDDAPDDGARLAREIGHLRFRGHDVILLQVLDPAEVTLPFRRAARFFDPESGLDLAVHPDRVRAAYRAALRSLCDDLHAICGRHGATYHRVTTDAPLDRALAGFFADRAGGVR